MLLLVFVPQSHPPPKPKDSTSAPPPTWPLNPRGPDSHGWTLPKTPAWPLRSLSHAHPLLPASTAESYSPGVAVASLVPRYSLLPPHQVQTALLGFPPLKPRPHPAEFRIHCLDTNGAQVHSFPEPASRGMPASHGMPASRGTPSTTCVLSLQCY